MSNYPDDIGNYDHDPRSPFYDIPDEEDMSDDCEEYEDDNEYLEE